MVSYTLTFKVQLIRPFFFLYYYYYYYSIPWEQAFHFPRYEKSSTESYNMYSSSSAAIDFLVDNVCENLNKNLQNLEVVMWVFPSGVSMSCHSFRRAELQEMGGSGLNL